MNYTCGITPLLKYLQIHTFLFLSEWNLDDRYKYFHRYKVTMVSDDTVFITYVALNSSLSFF